MVSAKSAGSECEQNKSHVFRVQIFEPTCKPYQKLTFNNNELDYVDSYKYLGMTIDSWLTFTQHLNNTLKTVSFRVMQLKRIRSSISHKIALQLYKCMILPILDYADIFYHNKNVSLLAKLQIIQNRCVRIISKLPRQANTESEEKKAWPNTPKCETGITCNPSCLWYCL